MIEAPNVSVIEAADPNAELGFGKRRDFVGHKRAGAA
jgi:hypothetical protein